MTYCDPQTDSLYHKTVMILKLFASCILYSLIFISEIVWKFISYFIKKLEQPVPLRPHPSSRIVLVDYPSVILAGGLTSSFAKIHFKPI